MVAPMSSHFPPQPDISDSIGQLDRRTILKLGLGTAAAATLGAAVLGAETYSSTPANATPNDPGLPETNRFYVSKPSHELFRTKPLHASHHAMQSFAFDNVNHRLFIAQERNGSNGDDLCINRVRFDGTVDGYMYLANAGHGVSIGVEPVGSDSYIWMECDSVGTGSNARGTALARFKFVNGAAPSGVKKFLHGSSTITCATDPIYHRLIIRRHEGNAFYYRVFDLTAAGKGDFTRELARIRQPSLWDGGTPVFQGYTALGSWLYIIDGEGHTKSSDINSYVRAVNLNSGLLRAQFKTKAGESIYFREPEGLAVYKPIGKAPRLFMGFAGHDHNGGPNRFANLYYKDVMGPN
jgi:hypothetical protein